MAGYSSILAWRIPQTEERGRLQSIGSQRVRGDLACFLFEAPIVLCLTRNLQIGSLNKILIVFNSFLAGYYVKMFHFLLQTSNPGISLFPKDSQFPEWEMFHDHNIVAISKPCWQNVYYLTYLHSYFYFKFRTTQFLLNLFYITSVSSTFHTKNPDSQGNRG